MTDAAPRHAIPRLATCTRDEKCWRERAATGPRFARWSQTICRKCYVHPGIIDCYLDGTLGETLGERLKRQSRRTSSKQLAGLRPQEAATLALLQARLDSDIAVPAGNPSAPRANIHADR